MNTATSNVINVLSNSRQYVRFQQVDPNPSSYDNIRNFDLSETTKRNREQKKIYMKN